MPILFLLQLATNPDNLNRPGLAVFDLDETLTRRDTYLPYLVQVLLFKPLRVFRCLPLPLYVVLYMVKLRDNTWLKIRFLNAILKGLSAEDLKPVNSRFIDKLVNHGLNPSTVKVLQQHIDCGDRLILLSASLDCYVIDIGKALGFNEIISTSVRMLNNRIAGGLSGPNLKGVEKLHAIQEYLNEEKDHYEITAYGDHKSDQQLLSWADKGYWVKSSPTLRALSNNKIQFLS